MTTDITELAQSHELRNKVNHRLYGALDFQGTSGEHATITLSIDECKSIIAAMDERLALVEALEKAQAQSSKWLEAYHKAVSIGARYEERIAELEPIRAAAEKLVRCKGRYHSEQNYRALAALFGVNTPDLPQLDSESRTVTDWIEHDGKWRPESLGLDELVYLKTRKQALKIPYPAGKVKGWVHRGCAMDVMAYKLASPQARTVTVKLPDIMPPEAAPAHYWGAGESMAYADGYNKSAADLKTSIAQACSSADVHVEFE